MDKRKEFLEEYRQLCVKYQMQIGACGCCNSPFVVKLGPVMWKGIGEEEIMVYDDGELVDKGE